VALTWRWRMCTASQTFSNRLGVRIATCRSSTSVKQRRSDLEMDFADDPRGYPKSISNYAREENGVRILA
jgi:hypothetical protein